MVLDASAVLAVVFAEPGCDRVVEALPRAVISSVNLGEVVAKLVDYRVAVPEINRWLTDLALEVVPFDADAGYAAGLMRRVEGAGELSLGDRSCLAVAQLRGEPAMTGDRQWSRIDVGVEIVLIR